MEYPWRRKNKDYKIYKFDYTCSKSRSKDEKKLDQLRWDRAKAMTNFKKKLIDDMCDENFEEIRKYTLWAEPLGIKKQEYKSVQIGIELWDGFEIGIDMLYKKYGMLHEHHWSSIYILVPIKQTELIKYFDEHAPEWVTNVKRI
jgi:hypothetical protein